MDENSCLFKTHSQITYKQYRNYLLKKILLPGKFISFYLIIFIAVLLYYKAFTDLFKIIAIFVAGSLILFLLVLYYAKSLYKTNKLSAEQITEFEFFDEYFTTRNEYSHSTIEYNKLYLINETKEFIVLLISKNQGILLNKSNLPDGLSNFLKNLSGVKYKQSKF